MNLQSIERLQNLLARVERNAKLPRTWTQGLAAFVAAPAAPAPATVAAGAPPPAVAALAAPPVAPLIAAAPAPVPVAAAAVAPVAVSEPLESLPSDAVEVEVEVSPLPPAAAAESVEPPPLEDVSLEEISGVEIEEPLAAEAQLQAAEEEIEEIPVEITSAITSEAPSEPEVESPPAAVATPFTAPPALDELTFSEPPPAQLEPTAAEIEPPPISAAQPVSEAPGSIDAALLAATEVHAHERPEEEQEEEGPALTPPPESGPQVAVPPMAAPAAPTLEQLGDVIDLEQVSGPPLELAPPASEPKLAASKPHEELEFVPQAPAPSRPIEGREPLQTLVGGFSEELGSGELTAPETPPPPARHFVPPAVATPPAAQVATPAPEAPLVMPRAAAPATAATDELEFGAEAPTASSVLVPEVVARAPVAAARPVVDVIAAARTYRPASFVELLDASIGLLKK